MIAVVLMTSVLALATALFHFTVLRFLSGGLARFTMRDGPRILIMIISVFSAHIVEIVMYAILYGLSVTMELGNFKGALVDDPLDYFYFSIVTFTSLGLGDIYPDEHLRFIAGIEALNGLLLIAWSGSFIFVAMNRLWPWRDCE